MTLDDLIETFALLESWEDRYGVIIDLGRQLQPLPAEAHNEQNKVRGCMSQVWMTVAYTEDDPPRLIFQGDSDAHIVKGLIGVLLVIFSGKTAREILDVDVEATFSTLNLAQHVSVNRRNGLYSMVERIKQLAQEALAAS